MISIGGLNELLQTVSFQITWIGAFSLWEADCDLEDEKNNDAFNLHLWQVEKLCQMFIQNRRGVIIDSKLLMRQVIKNKDISYGFFRVFYVNYFHILAKYRRKNGISEETWYFLKKDLLYNCFLPWLVEFKLRRASLRWADNEALDKDIYKYYSKEAYFADFDQKYRRKMFIAKFKQYIKHIPLLGFCFVKVKQWLRKQ